MASEFGNRVSAVLTVDRTAFDRRVQEEVQALKAAISDGAFDNPQAIVGLEYEFYGATAFPGRDGSHVELQREAAGSLRRVPRRLLELVGFEKELGLHNAEMTTSPQPLNGHGLDAQQAEVRARLTAALAKTRADGIRLVSDGMWTIPPAGESARRYLTDSAEVEGLTVGTNVSKGVRYHGFVNGDYEPRLELDAPHVSLQADNPAPLTLTSSIQPHYQVPHAPDLPEHFRYALRVAAPLLALGTNSPLFPPELYDDDVPGERILADGWDEHRIRVFETVLNPRDSSPKVRFPRDVETVEQAVDRLADDEPAVPIEVEAAHRFDDRFAHLRHKHGTYWRWVRPVFEGATRSAANTRIEFRPLPGQPTVRDAIAFQAAFAGLMESLPRREHPVAGLDWETARDNFYRVVEDGLDADIEWRTIGGRGTTDPEAIFGELFEYARDGLELRGLSGYEAQTTLRPLRTRFEHRTSPADWKRDRVRERLADGEGFEQAVYGMQREYVRRQTETLIDGTFADWLRS